MSGNGLSWCPDAPESVTTVHPHKLRFSGSVSHRTVTSNNSKKQDNELDTSFERKMFLRRK